MSIKFKYFVLAVSALTLLASCAVTTRMTEGTTETFGNTTEASSTLTFSTSLRSDDDNSAEVKQFMRINMARLRADMAVGKGEYLVNLAVLLDIEETKKTAFYQMTKDQFKLLFASPDTSAEELLAKLNKEVTRLSVS